MGNELELEPFDETTGQRIAAGLGGAIADPATAGTRNEVDRALLDDLTRAVVLVRAPPTGPVRPRITEIGDPGQIELAGQETREQMDGVRRRARVDDLDALFPG